MTIQDEVNKRKTFAIISHPDAGKTTMTEKTSAIRESDPFSRYRQREKVG